MSNAQERGSVRQQLLQTQAELADARAELHLWAQNAGSAAGAAESEVEDQKVIEQENGSCHEGEQGSELPSSVATLMDNLTDLSAQLAKDAVADEQAFEL